MSQYSLNSSGMAQERQYLTKRMQRRYPNGARRVIHDLLDGCGKRRSHNSTSSFRTGPLEDACSPGRPLPSALFSHVQPAPPTGSFASIAMAESPTHDEDVQITKGSRLAVLLEQEEMCAASDVP